MVTYKYKQGDQTRTYKAVRQKIAIASSLITISKLNNCMVPVAEKSIKTVKLGQNFKFDKILISLLCLPSLLVLSKSILVNIIYVR